MAFALHYAAALGAVALMLVGLQAAARAYAARRGLRSVAGRNITILESASLGPGAMLHIVEIESRRYLIGSAASGVALLRELRSS